MNALARLMLCSGSAVSGSDRDESPALHSLKSAGAAVFTGHAAENVPDSADLVVASAAIPADNPEIAAANSRGIRVVKYAQALGLLMSEKTGFAVAGTHGKTTTTSMVAHALMALGADPSVVVGGEIPAIGGSSRAGKGKFFVAEACEYDRSFHNYSPKYAIITNVEPDHLDYYKDLDEIIESFAVFAAKVPKSGAIAVCMDNANAIRAVEKAACRVVTYGANPKSDYQLGKVRLVRGCVSFEASKGDTKLGVFELGVAGRHNALNALGAAAALEAAGFEASGALNTLSTFTGARRRFELVAAERGIRVYDDYGHHPTELITVLSTARECFPLSRIWAVFQPHQYHRTKMFLGEFASVLKNADAVVIPPIYAARDSAEAMKSVCAEDLVKRVNELGGRARFAPSVEEAAALCIGEMREGDVFITLGAGDIWRASQIIKDAVEIKSEKCVDKTAG